MRCKIVLTVTFLAYVLGVTSGKAFLYNSPRAITDFISSASASASRPAEPLSHIANLRKTQEKAARLQVEKQLVEDDESDGFALGDNDGDNNEVSPSVLQKKVNKILNKLRLISSLKAATTESSDGSPAKASEARDFEREFDEDEENDVSEDSTIKMQTLQKIIYPHSSDGEPLKITLDISEQVGSEPQVEEPQQERLGQIGIFFAELLGSIVGLVYGAAAQITNTVEANSARTV